MTDHNTSHLWNISNVCSGVDLDSYSGVSETDALDAMARDAGYRDQSHALEVTDSDGSDLLVTRIS